MHHIHVTDGVVCAKRSVGEANSLVYVLTESLGLVRAQARSTRVEASKLRYGLEPLTAAQFSFVKGKHEWRLVQVERASNVFASSSPTRRRSAARVAQLLLRLVQGAEYDPRLYSVVASGFASLAVAPKDEEADAIECVIVLRALSYLGYLPHTEALAQFVEGDFSIDLAAKALESRSLLVRTINESLQATGL